MAAVKAYVAQWLQLGKRLELPGRSTSAAIAETVAGERYTANFENLWYSILHVELGNVYLLGTDVKIADLLTGTWELHECARCGLPVPLPPLGQAQVGPCVCADLSTWPNAETVPPHPPIASSVHLQGLRQRMEEAPMAPQPPTRP
ncbi:MAG TPA: hypothetical protein DCQ32_03035 [Cyanobacteria bacterium UBA8156]|nr:hypothetical protein [Cyanobacteria bacterium UBA8156]